MRFSQRTLHVYLIFVTTFILTGCKHASTNIYPKELDSYIEASSYPMTDSQLEELLFLSSDLWLECPVEIREDLQGNVHTNNPFYLSLIVSEPSKSFREINEDESVEERDCIFFFSIDSSYKCSYVCIRHLWYSKNGKIAGIKSIYDRFTYNISESDFLSLIDKIGQTKVLRYGEIYIDEHDEHPPGATLTICHQFVQEIHHNAHMPKEIRPLYDFIRNKLIADYISNIESIRMVSYSDGPEG